MIPLAEELSAGHVCFFPLVNALIYRVSGRDAQRYLNARLSNNIKDLTTGAGCAAAALSPQGRTELFGTVLKIGAEEFLFIVDGGEEPEVRATLSRYKVADRVDFTHLPELALIHVINKEHIPLEEAHYTLSRDAREYSPYHNQAITLFPIKRSPVLGYDIILPQSRATDLTKLLDTESAKQFESTQQVIGRILAKRPSFPTELNDEGIFLEAGLSHAVSFTKGCYVGQEVLEKVDSHGRLPFSVVSLASINQVTTAPEKDLPISLKDNTGQSVGTVITGALDSSSGTGYCFARIKSAHLVAGNVFTIQEQEYQLI